MLSIIDADSRNPAFVRVPGLEIVRVIVITIAGGSHVENRVVRPNPQGIPEPLEHPALVPSDPDR
jgi:hypothetical protein